MKTFLTIFLTAAVAAAATWLLLRDATPEIAASGKEPLYYQSAMHPWIKSDKPGRCTICGMELTPVYAGEKGFDESGGEDIIALSDSQVRVLNVATEKAAVRELGQTLEVAGTIDDDERTHRIVSAYVGGRIDMLFANHHGAPVIEGEPLMMIYSPTLLQTEREYRRLTGDLKLAAALRLKQMGLTEKQIAEVDSKPEDALYSMILAPVSGTVITHTAYEGKYVEEGENLMEIGDFSTMWFLFDAYEQDLPFIKVGQKIDVTLPSQPGKIFPGVVSFIDPNFNETTRTTEVRVDLPNPVINATGRRELFHKVYAEGTLKIDNPPVLTVPRSAVIQTGAQAFVYLDQGSGAYRQVPVKTGKRGDGFLEILSGLSEGDEVVTNGTLLIDGQAEMNRSYTSASAKKATTALSPEQASSISAFLETADAMSAALAADDLPAFSSASEPAMTKAGDLVEKLKGIAPQDALEKLESSRHFHGFKDISAARASYLPFSMAAQSILAPLRDAENFPQMKIFECPMVDAAIPGAEKKGRWLQTGDRPIRNPYFGSEMLTCGKEIKP